jgi:carboxyl-terminal processing protease
MTRAVIHIPSVSSEMLPGGIGYTELAQFAEDTSPSWPRDRRPQGPGMKGLIIDLRDNTGGYLEQAVSVSSLFLPPASWSASRRAAPPSAATTTRVHVLHWTARWSCS